MKPKIYFLSLFFTIFIANNTFAQNLSFDDFIDLKKKSLSGFNEYLNSRGWETLEDESGNKTINSNKLIHKSSGSTIGFVRNDEDQNNKISLFITQKDIYSQYITKMNGLGYRLIKAEVENGDIVKVYQGKKNTIKVTTITNTSNYSIPTTNSYIFLTL